MRSIAMLPAGAIAMAALAGCGFDPSGLGGGTSDDGRRTDAGDVDSPGGGVDAPGSIDAPNVVIDAPCPDLDRDGVCDDQDSWDCGGTTPSANFPGNLGSRQVFDAGIGVGVPPPTVTQLAPNEQSSLSLNIGAQGGGSYRVGEVNGRYYGCRNASENILGWVTIPFSVNAARGTAVALTAQFTSNCNGSDWQGGAPSTPIVAHYCVR